MTINAPTHDRPTATRVASLFVVAALLMVAPIGCGERKPSEPAPRGEATKLEAKPGITQPPEAKPEAKAEAKPETKPEVKAETKPETTAAPAPTPSAPAGEAKKDEKKDNVKISKEYWENGKLKFTYEMRKSSNGKWARNGIGRAYYDTGELEREGPYKNNVRVGKWTYYKPDGQVLRTEERGADGKGGATGEPPLP